METSSITITALTATPTLRGNKLKATVSAVGPAANLPNLTLKTVVFYASTINDYTTAIEIARGNPEALDAGLIEEQTYYYWAFAVDNSDYSGAVFPVSPTAGVACTAIGMSGLAFGLANGKLVATVFGNALTIAVKTAAGNDPSNTPDGAVYLAFRNPTLATGNYQIRSLTDALSLVISSGSTLDTPTVNTPFRVWVVIFDDAGTLRLGAVNCLSANGRNIYPLDDTALRSSTAEGGAGTADSPGIIYTGVAVSAKPFRIVGYLEWTTGLASAGAWASDPDVIRLFGYGSRRPGEVVQDFLTLDNSGLSNTTLIPLDTTIPQLGEGSTVYTTDSITPSSPVNVFEFEILLHVSYTVASAVIGALFRDSVAGAFAACWTHISAANELGQLELKHRRGCADAAARVYKFNIGGVNAGRWTINGINSVNQLGGQLYASVRVRELMA